MNKTKFLTIAALSLALALALPFFTDGGFGHLLAVFFVQIFITLPLALAALILYAVKRRKPEHPQRTAKLLGTVALALFIQTISLPILGTLDSNRVKAGKEYCESLIPLIEQYLRAHSKYPDDIKQLPPAAQPMPTFLAQQRFYHAASDGFAFDFHTPASFMNSYLYDSDTREWMATD